MVLLHCMGSGPLGQAGDVFIYIYWPLCLLVVEAVPCLAPCAWQHQQGCGVPFCPFWIRGYWIASKCWKSTVPLSCGIATSRRPIRRHRLLGMRRRTGTRGSSAHRFCHDDRRRHCVFRLPQVTHGARRLCEPCMHIPALFACMHAREQQQHSLALAMHARVWKCARCCNAAWPTPAWVVPSMPCPRAISANRSIPAHVHYARPHTCVGTHCV